MAKIVIKNKRNLLQPLDALMLLRELLSKKAICRARNLQDYRPVPGILVPKNYENIYEVVSTQEYWYLVTRHGGYDIIWAELLVLSGRGKSLYMGQLALLTPL